MATALAAVVLAAAPVSATETGLSGLWLLTPGQRQPLNPPLTPEYKARAEEAQKNTRVLAKQRCLPTGMPGMFRNELPFEIVESSERVAIIGEQTALARTIYKNAVKWSDDIVDTWNGNSYGKWEGKSFVAHTAKFNDRVSHVPGAPAGSADTVITERFTVVEGGKGLLIQMTFKDPKVLTKPWSLTIHYDRQAPGAQRWEYVCDVDDPQWNTALGVTGEEDKK